MANPKYGSEKKGAPTNYYLTVAPSQIKVNCELNHVDRRALLRSEGVHAHESTRGDQERRRACLGVRRITRGRLATRAREVSPVDHRKQHRIYILPGFDIAKKATNQTELQLRMQGNSFLGAFFRVSPFLKTFGITEENFQKVVHKQYVKKFRPLRRRRRRVEHDPS